MAQPLPRYITPADNWWTAGRAFIRCSQSTLKVSAPYFSSCTDVAVILHTVNMVMMDLAFWKLLRPFHKLIGVLLLEKISVLKASKAPRWSVTSKDDGLWWLQTGAACRPDHISPSPQSLTLGSPACLEAGISTCLLAVHIKLGTTFTVTAEWQSSVLAIMQKRPTAKTIIFLYLCMDLIYLWISDAWNDTLRPRGQRSHVLS